MGVKLTAANCGKGRRRDKQVMDDNVINIECAQLFEIKNGDAYQLKMKDFGNAGVQIVIAGQHDSYGAIVPPPQVGKLIEWLCGSSGQSSQQLRSYAIELLLKEASAGHSLKAGQKRMLKQAAGLLQTVVKKKTPKAKRDSTEARAISR